MRMNVINDILKIKSRSVFKLLIIMTISLNTMFIVIYLSTINGHAKIVNSLLLVTNEFFLTPSFSNVYGYPQQDVFAVQNQSNSESTPSNAITSTNITNLFSTSSGNSLDIKVEPTPIPIRLDDTTKFKIYFYELNSSQIQVHVDYDFVIIKDGTEVFSAAKKIQQPLLHTAEGIVTIPYKFVSSGNYTLKVLIFGINFIPISPEESTFNIFVN